MTDWFVAVLLVIGGLFCLLGGVGILRMPDLFTRMQAATKAGTLGAGLVTVAAALAFEDLGAALRCGLVIVFLFLTAPVGAHLIARAAHRSGVSMWGQTRVDQLRDRPDTEA
jgi:multicomponent Na+:H+ antiporter subunit G